MMFYLHITKVYQLSIFSKLFSISLHTTQSLAPFQNFVKRCVALPGDTVRISDGVVYINGISQSYPIDAKIEYNIYLKIRDIFNSLHSSLNQDNTNVTYNTIK